MIGGIIMVLVILAFPIGIFLSGAVGAGIIGWFLRDDADRRHAGSELLDLNG